MLEDQYDRSFLRLNPLGEVPVIKHGGKVIPDSSAILQYLENNFNEGI